MCSVRASWPCKTSHSQRLTQLPQLWGTDEEHGIFLRMSGTHCQSGDGFSHHHCPIQRGYLLFREGEGCVLSSAGFVAHALVIIFLFNLPIWRIFKEHQTSYPNNQYLNQNTHPRCEGTYDYNYIQLNRFNAISLPWIIPPRQKQSFYISHPHLHTFHPPHFQPCTCTPSTPAP